MSPLPSVKDLRNSIKNEAKKLRKEKVVKKSKKPSKLSLLKEMRDELIELDKEFSRREILKILEKSGLKTSSGTLRKVLEDEEKPAEKEALSPFPSPINNTPFP